MTKVSIVIPLYKCEKFIGETISSILAQTYEDFELIICDDHSPDNSYAIAESFNDNRIKLSRNPKNLGPEGNWNRCLQQATGEYIKLVCQDDILEPECVEKQVAVLEDPQNSDVSIVCCSRFIINGKGDKVFRRGFKLGSGKFVSNDVVKSLVHWGTNTIGEPAAVLFRKQHVGLAGPFSANPPYTIDVDYWCKLLSYGKIFALEEPLCGFRISTQNWTYRLGRKQFSDYVQFIVRLVEEHKFALSPIDGFIGRLSTLAQFIMRSIFIRLFA